MLRRRMMMDTKPTQDWDVAWDYTMGFPEDNGFEKYVVDNGNYFSINLESDGLRILFNKAEMSGGAYVRYCPVDYRECSEGIYEAELQSNAYVRQLNGCRIILGNSNLIGNQVAIFEQALNYNYGGVNVYKAIKSIVANEWYTVRIERKAGVNYVFLNGEKVYETSTEISTGGTSENRIFFQSYGDYLLKSIKFKKIS